jgi:hypothetical protein
MSNALSDPTTSFKTLMSKLHIRAAVLQQDESANQYTIDISTNSASSRRLRDREEVTVLYTDYKFLGRIKRHA